MSYILDALKKSDAERKQGNVPNLQTIHIPVSAEPTAPLGLYGVISVLLLLLAFVAGWLLTDKEPAQIVQVAELAPKSVPTVSVPVAQIPERKAAAQVKPVVSEAATKPAPVIMPKKEPVKAVKPHVEVAAKATPKVMAAQQEAPADDNKNQPDAQANSAIPDLSDIPYLHEMPEYQQQSIPQMTFAGHVYSSNPGSRSVIINDVFMSEGDAVLPGINVIQITAGGVVFSLHDGYFRIDILQDWSFE